MRATIAELVHCWKENGRLNFLILEFQTYLVHIHRYEGASIEAVDRIFAK